MATRSLTITPAQIERALSIVADAIRAGAEGTNVDDLTERGVLLHLFLALDIAPEVSS